MSAEVNPARLTGPEVGTLCRITSKYDWLSNRVVLVLERSYVWGPDQPNGGHRRYDSSVIQYGTGKSGKPFTVVVDDKDLTPIAPGDILTRYRERHVIGAMAAPR